MAENRTFRSDALNLLNCQSDVQRSRLAQVALSQPNRYYQFRARAIRTLVHGFVRSGYSAIWSVLTTGLNDQAGEQDEQRVFYFENDVPGTDITAGAFAPRLSEPEINKVALEFAAQVKKAVEEIVIERVCPAKLFELATDRIIARRQAQQIGGE